MSPNPDIRSNMWNPALLPDTIFSYPDRYLFGSEHKISAVQLLFGQEETRYGVVLILPTSKK